MQAADVTSSVLNLAKAVSKPSKVEVLMAVLNIERTQTLQHENNPCDSEISGR